MCFGFFRSTLFSMKAVKNPKTKPIIQLKLSYEKNSIYAIIGEKLAFSLTFSKDLYNVIDIASFYMLSPKIREYYFR